MSSIKDITASTPVPADIVEKIGINGVNEILAIMWRGYIDLRNDKTICIGISTQEDNITQEWYVKIQNLWRNENRASQIYLNNFCPINQYEDDTMQKTKNSKSPTIDFCFRDMGEKYCYFGAECKNLYFDDARNLKRYIETGIVNFTSGRYSYYASQAALIGYVLKGSIKDIVDKLQTKIKIGGVYSNIYRTSLVKYPQYKSVQKREKGDEIIIYHLFFDFVS